MNRRSRAPRLLPIAMVLTVALSSATAGAAPPPSDAEARYEQTDRNLAGATAGLGGGAGALLIASLALHISANRKANECASDVFDSLTGPNPQLDLEACEQADNRVAGRNVALLGFGLAGVGAIITGVLLAKHRRERPQRFSVTGDGFLVRF